LPDKTSAAKEYCPKDRERGDEAMQDNDQWSALIDPVGSLQQIMTIESGTEKLRSRALAITWSLSTSQNYCVA